MPEATTNKTLAHTLADVFGPQPKIGALFAEVRGPSSLGVTPASSLSTAFPRLGPASSLTRDSLHTIMAELSPLFPESVSRITATISKGFGPTFCEFVARGDAWGRMMRPLLAAFAREWEADRALIVQAFGIPPSHADAPN